MEEFDFAKSNGLIIRLDGKILGGVKKAVCTKKNSFTDVGEFLTDIPVSRIPESGYTIVLTMNYSNENPFLLSDSFDRINFESSNGTVTYSKCFADSVETTLNAKGLIESKVTVSAEERSSE